MKIIIATVTVVLLSLSAVALAAQNAEGDYVGGRGVITVTGPTGMFLNPTSGIAVPKGGITTQACLAALPVVDNTEHHILLYYMAAYAPLDWLELGFQGIMAQQNSDTHLAAWGGQVRGRFVKDEEWWPEVSVGFSMFEGPQTHVERRDVYLALSKHFKFHDGKFFRGIRFHSGGRFWSSPVADDTVAGYGGGEIELYPGIWFVGEVQTRDGEVDRFTPYAFGVQGRAKNGWGVTLAGVQTGGTGYVNFPGRPGASGATGGTKKPAIYVGVGVSFF